MFHVRIMSVEDFAFAIDVTNPMDWGLIEADFKFMLKLEPEGCFVLFDDSDKVGIATTVSFGQAGWFGNLIVRGDKRKKGGGSLLVSHALRYLSAKSVKMVGLYAYPDVIPFYTKLGFMYDSDFTVLKGRGVSSSVDAHVTVARRQNFGQIIKFDENCFGALRKKVLYPILSDPGNFCYIFLEDDRLVGFVAASVYGKTAELGPLVCSRNRSDVAISLINAALNRLKDCEVTLCVRKREVSIIDTLTGYGFSESFKVSRMFFGSPVTGDCIYAAESLERG